MVVLKALMMTGALIAATAGSLARGDDVVPPPSPMQGGVAVELIDPLPPGVDRIKIGNSSALVFTGDVQRSSRRVAEILTPATTGGRYLVKGWIRYANLESDAFIEMWNHFGEKSFFSRTLGDGGPTGKITGSSDWRVFLLPFNPDQGRKPDRLEVNLVLPGKGTVTIADVRLVDCGAAEKKAFVLPPGSIDVDTRTGAGTTPGKPSSSRPPDARELRWAAAYGCGP